jgi:hypothetical protein
LASARPASAPDGPVKPSGEHAAAASSATRRSRLDDGLERKRDMGSGSCEECPENMPPISRPG